MKTFLLLITLTLSISAAAQEYKIIKRISGNYLEKYSVRKSDKIKEGRYVMLSKPHKDTIVSGQFENGIKVGLWKYKFNENYLSFNFDDNSYYYPIKLDTDSFYIKIDNSFMYTKVDAPPIYLGYENEIRILVASNLKLPSSFLNRTIIDYSLGYFTINSSGEIEDIGIEKSLGNEFDQNIINSIKLVKGVWFPALKDGKPIISKVYLLINISPGKIVNKYDNKPYLYVVDMVYYTTTTVKKL